MGTPPQPVSVVFDTGSQTLEFATTDCSSCNQTNKFDKSKSSTFKAGSRTSTLNFATGVGVDPVVNNDYVLTIRSATDSVTVGGITTKNVKAGNATKSMERVESRLMALLRHCRLCKYHNQ